MESKSPRKTQVFILSKKTDALTSNGFRASSGSAQPLLVLYNRIRAAQSLACSHNGFLFKIAI